MSRLFLENDKITAGQILTASVPRSVSVDRVPGPALVTRRNQLAQSVELLSKHHFGWIR